jgi:hypothetical protein
MVRRPSEQKVTDDESSAINFQITTRNNKEMFRFFYREFRINSTIFFSMCTLMLLYNVLSQI